MKEDLKQLTAPLRYRKKKSKEDTKTLSTNSTALLKRKSTLHKNKPGVSGGGGGGLQPYLTPHAAKPRERLSAPFDLIYCRLLKLFLPVLHFLGNPV